MTAGESRAVREKRELAVHRERLRLARLDANTTARDIADCVARGETIPEAAVNAYREALGVLMQQRTAAVEWCNANGFDARRALR